MNTQVIPKVPPIWVIIGLGILVFCGAVVLCLAVSTIGLSLMASSRGSEAEQSTVQATATQIPTPVILATTPAPLASTPTQIPLPGVLPPLPVVPTSVGNFAMGVNTADPAGAVHTYFQWVDDNRYDLTWPMLSARFKEKFNCCAPNYNYTGYVDWWNSVDHIDFADVHTVQQGSGWAVVYMELHYLMKAGGVSTDRGYLHLVYDPAAGWLFDDKTDTL